MHLYKVGLAFVLMLTLVACKSKQAGTEPSKTEGSKETTASSKTDGSQETTVKLLDPGSDPRQKLRYKFQPGKQDVLIMDMKTAMAVELGANQQPEIALPVMRLIMTLDSKAVTPDGNLRYEFVTNSAEVVDADNANPGIVSSMQAELKKIEGMALII